MSHSIASIYISDAGIRILVGIIDGVFHSWYHDKINNSLVDSSLFDIETFKIKLNAAIEHAQHELHRVIDSWYLVYDVDNVKLTSLKNYYFPNYYITKSSENDIKVEIENKCKSNKNEIVIAVEPIRYEWRGRKGKVVSEVLPEIGKKITNLRVDSIIYRANRKKLDLIKKIVDSCDISVNRYISSCFAYPHALTNIIEKKITCVVDIGDNTSKVMVFRNNTLIDYKIIDQGALSFTKKINKKYSIENLSRAQQIIKDNFSFAKKGNQNITIHTSLSKKNRQRVELPKGLLRKEGRKVYYELHLKIDNYLQSIIKELFNKYRIPIFITGKLTNVSGYQNFLDKHFPHMRYLDISRIEDIDNSFIALLGMMELIRLDISKSYCHINCVTKQSYNKLTWFTTKLLKHTNKFGKIFIGG